MPDRLLLRFTTHWLEVLSVFPGGIGSTAAPNYYDEFEQESSKQRNDSRVYTPQFSSAFIVASRRLPRAGCRCRSSAGDRRMRTRAERGYLEQAWSGGRTQAGL